MRNGMYVRECVCVYRYCKKKTCVCVCGNSMCESVSGGTVIDNMDDEEEREGEKKRKEKKRKKKKGKEEIYIYIYILVLYVLYI